MSLPSSRPGVSLGRLRSRTSSAGRIAGTYLRVGAPSNARAVAQPPAASRSPLHAALAPHLSGTGRLRTWYMGQSENQQERLSDGAIVPAIVFVRPRPGREGP